MEPAKTKDLDGWIASTSDVMLIRRLIKVAAESTARLHGYDIAYRTASNETLQTFKGNALYDVRKIKGFLTSNVLQTQGARAGVSRTDVALIAEKIQAATAKYEMLLETDLKNFMPAVTHGTFTAAIFL